MISPFGVDHGEFSKGLPSAVKAGGGGGHGSLLRMKNSVGRSAGKLLGQKAYSPQHAANLKSLAGFEQQRGKHLKGVVEQSKFDAHMKQYGRSDEKTSQVSRSIRAGLLNDDSAARRRGYKTGKSSALDRHYRGRVNDMRPLP